MKSYTWKITKFRVRFWITENEFRKPSTWSPAYGVHLSFEACIIDVTPSCRHDGVTEGQTEDTTDTRNEAHATPNKQTSLELHFGKTTNFGQSNVRHCVRSRKTTKSWHNWRCLSIFYIGESFFFSRLKAFKFEFREKNCIASKHSTRASKWFIESNKHFITAGMKVWQTDVRRDNGSFGPERPWAKNKTYGKLPSQHQ